MSPLRKLAPFALACAVVGASLALAACGGSANGSTANQEKRNEQDLVKFGQCMREHGIEVSTKSSGGSSSVRISGHAGTGNQHALEAAQNACKRYQPTGGRSLSPAERTAAEDAALRFAQCMRSHGVDVPNPTFSSSGGFGIKIQGVNPNSPGFQAAQQACQGLLPKPPGAGKGLSTGSSSSSGPGPSLGIAGG